MWTPFRIFTLSSIVLLLTQFGDAVGPLHAADVACTKVTTEDFRKFEINSRVTAPLVPSLEGEGDPKLYTAVVKEVLSSNSYSIQFEHDNSIAVKSKTDLLLVDPCQCFSKKGRCQPYAKGERGIFCACAWHQDSGNICHEGFDRNRNKGGVWDTSELEMVIKTCPSTFVDKADALAMLSEINSVNSAPSDNTVGTIVGAVFGSIIASCCLACIAAHLCRNMNTKRGAPTHVPHTPHVPQAIPAAYPAEHQAAPQPPPVGVPTGIPLNMQGLPCAPSFCATTTGVLLNVQGLPTGVHSNGLPCAPSFNTIEEENNPPPRPAAEEETEAQGEVYSGGGSAGLVSAIAAAEVCATPLRNGGVATERDLESGSLLV
jgi:hypothetical protein